MTAIDATYAERDRSHPAAWTAALTIDRWIVAAVGAGLALRTIRLGDAALWFDETWTAQWVQLPWAEMVATVLGDNHPPFYFLFLKAWSAVFGSSAVALRLPSALASALCVPLIAAAAGVAGGGRAARWAAWLAACAPLLIHHGQEARMYTPAALFASLQFLLVVRFLHGEAGRLGASFAISGILLTWTHYYGAIFVLSEVMALALIEPHRWRNWLGAATAAGIAIVPAALGALLLACHQAGGEYEIGPFAIPGALWALIAGYTFLPSSAELHAAGLQAALPFAWLAAPTALCVGLAAHWGMRRLAPRISILILMIIGIVLLAPYAASLVLAVGTHPRYAVSLLGPLLVLLSASLPVKGEMGVRTAVVAMILLIMALGTARHLADPAHGREDVRAAGRWLDAHVSSQEEILVTSEEMAQLAEFHWSDRRLRLYPARKTVVTEGNATRLATELPVASSPRIFYVIGREWVSDPQGLLVRELQRLYPKCGDHRVQGVRILCLQTEPLSKELF